MRTQRNVCEYCVKYGLNSQNDPASGEQAIKGHAPEPSHLALPSKFR